MILMPKAAPLHLVPGNPDLDRSISLARLALAEVTEIKDVGDFLDIVDEGSGAYAVRFTSLTPGFTDWYWTVSMTQLDDAEAPSVLECGLLPAADALLAPEWVPWAKRLADFEATHDDQGNLLPEGEAGERAQLEEPRAPRSRTRTRKRTRRRVRTDSDAVSADAVSSDSTTGGNGDSSDLPEAADIREFADEMDDVFDGVTFENGDAAEER